MEKKQENTTRTADLKKWLEWQKKVIREEMKELKSKRGS